MTALGGKAGRTPAARQVVETGQSLNVKSLAPFADDLPGGVETGRDAIVTEPLTGQKHDPGPEDIAIR